MKQEIDISDEIRRLIPIIGKERATKLEIAYLLGDETYRERVQEIVDAIKAFVLADDDLKDSILIEPPPREIAENGEFEFGDVLYGKKRLYPLFLNKRDLLTHIGIFGSSGSGKTNVIHQLISTLNKLDIPIVVFDFSKRNYRDLLRVPELKDKIKIYTIGRNISPYRFNPLKPPEGVQISQWAKEFSEVFDHAYWLLGGGRHVVLKALGDVYKECNPGMPRIQDLNDWLDTYGSIRLSPRERNWLATAGRPLESLCFMESGDIFSCEEGILPSTFFEKGKITILELDALSTNDKTFFIEILLQWIRDWILVKGVREKLFGVIILEEAHNVLNREKGKRLGMETVMDIVFREIRELGIGMIYVDQHPSLVSYPALGNTNTHVYMNLGLDTQYSSDIQDASRMLGLKTEEEIAYLRRLPVGNGFILVRKSVFPNPFLVQFPLIGIEKGSVGDEEVRDSMKIKRVEEVKRKFDKKKDNLEKIKIGLDSSYLKILEVLNSSQAISISGISKAVKMSGRILNENLKRLISLGLVDSRKVKLYKQNSNIFFLTEDGEFICKEKFDKINIIDEIDGNIKNRIINEYTLNHWSFHQDMECMVFERGGGKNFIRIVDDFSNVSGFIDKNIGKGEMYFVCSSEQKMNWVFQQVSKYSLNFPYVNFTIFATTPKDLEDGKWKRVEFKAFT